VFASAVVLDPSRQIRGLDDSKQLSPDRRAVLASEFAIAPQRGPLREPMRLRIDRINILPASATRDEAGDERLLPHLAIYIG